MLSRGDLLDVSPESFDRCIAVNTRGTFFLTQAFARRMIADGAEPAPLDRDDHLVQRPCRLAAARRILPVQGGYVHGVHALRCSVSPTHGIGVYEVQPGLIATEMTAPSKARYDAQIEAGLTAIRRWGEPEEVARIVVTMASGLLPYTVGQAIMVDGGLTIARF